MPKYNVHIYREMRIKYKDVVAPSPRRAAVIMRHVDPEMCNYEYETHECEGQTFCALVDTLAETGESDDIDTGVKHEDPFTFADGVMRDFAPELFDACKQQHKAIDTLLAMLIEKVPGFLPTQCPVWESVVNGNSVIEAVQKSLDNCTVDRV